MNMSVASEHSQERENEGHVNGAEHAPELEELSQNVLGLIGAYRMGAALDAEDLLPTRSTSVSSPAAGGGSAS
jgi:hypothetical protein